MSSLFRATCSCGKTSPRYACYIGANNWSKPHRKNGHTTSITNAGTAKPWSPQ